MIKVQLSRANKAKLNLWRKAMPKETFADRLKDALNRQGMKQVDVIRAASQAGVKLGKSHMSQYVSGKTIPREEILRFLAKTLQVTPEWLAGGESEPERLAGAGNEPEEQAAGRSERKRQTAGSEPEEQAAGRSEPERQTGAGSTASARQPESAAVPRAGAAAGSDSDKENSGGRKMREFKKSSKLNNVLYDVRGPVVDEAERMEEAGTQILKLNIGNPAPFGFRTPDEVIYDMRQQLTECEGYSNARGLFSARKAIMQYAQVKGLPNVSIENIYTGNGVSELINISMSALLDDGDEVLIPSPDYPLWTACATLAGGKAVHYVCDEQADWYPDIDDIRKKVTDRTKAIVIINPNNPTGALYPKEVLEQIVQVAREHQLIIFSDEIYDRLVMDGEKHISIASLAPDLFCVTFSGLSKSHMIAGFRIGWMILSGRLEMAKDYMEGLNMLSNMRLCSNVPAQSIVQTALWGYQSVNSYIVPGGRIYEQREYIYKALNDIPGVSAVKPKAAFYIFPKLDLKKFNIVNDEKFALDLLKEKKLLVVQGSGFNWKQPDHFRVVYLPRIEILKEAMGKLGDFLSYYRQ
ncbi:MAG TPA: aminotransferase class I/II-fold pyridoxal phosphate-dependent enzyme [Candidatus Limivivens intestinipullorum]|uniref:alanine transaminase n=1 Tax=Candidatus Limivivens intestinipullorum TaxID=2840858 RepID=A0A9D1ESP3_9FIRM|nr:aminotransferase class I/II-fold pyridoxal phosphate-dependent enzyme [Candidatus Limivivens intestinipullorum]